MKYPWGEHTREQYLAMIDRQWPFWFTVTEFVLVNGIKSIVEPGCGIGHLCHCVDSYTGIDFNQTVLTSNELFYRRGAWLCGDWMEMDGLAGELFVAGAVIEHMKTPDAFLEKMLTLPWSYAIVAFPERMRAAITAWVSNIGPWHFFDLPVSRRPRQVLKVSVLVIDRTGTAQLDMWSRRAL